MTYFITGANGFLGSYLIKNILERTTDRIIATDLKCPKDNSNGRIKWLPLDITDEKQMKSVFKHTQTEQLKVLFLAAYLHPDLVEKNPKTAWKINIVALAKFFEIFDNIDSFYYPSTEVVYGQARKRPFKEKDVLKPVSLYGRQKSVAEKMVLSLNYNVVRFPVLIGPSLFKERKHFFDEIIEKVSAGQTVEMFYDQYRSFIDFNTAAKTLVDLVETPEAGRFHIVNIAGDEALSKYELGVRICKWHDLNSQYIIPINMTGDQKIFKFAKRSRKTLLDNSLVKKILNLKELKLEV